MQNEKELYWIFWGKATRKNYVLSNGRNFNVIQYCTVFKVVNVMSSLGSTVLYQGWEHIKF